MFFKTSTRDEPVPSKNEYAQHSAYGRGITSIQSAKDELYRQPKHFNPLQYLEKNRYF